MENEKEAYLLSKVTGHQTVLYQTSENKQQSFQWHHPNSPSAKQVPNSITHTRKGVVLIELFLWGKTKV